ncbi:MAG: Crp/Fnr family transcriptional regulator [Candidatus Binatia bacterium]
MDKAQLIDASPLFRGLSSAGRSRIGEVLIVRNFERDSVVYLRGDEAVAFYGVAEGRVRFSAASVEGKEVVLDYAGPGQWFGEIGLFDGGPRIVDARTAEATRLHVLAQRDLLALCRSESELLLRFVELFSRRIRTAEDIIIDASFLSLPARLAKKLLHLAADAERAEMTPRGPAVRISQDELGRLTGVTRESAGKQLKLWEREGIVAVDYGRVIVVDLAHLRRLVAAAIGD